MPEVEGKKQSRELSVGARWKTWARSRMYGGADDRTRFLNGLPIRALHWFVRTAIFALREF